MNDADKAKVWSFVRRLISGPDIRALLYVFLCSEFNKAFVIDKKLTVDIFLGGF
jgi:hypothetical protein